MIIIHTILFILSLPKILRHFPSLGTLTILLCTELKNGYFLNSRLFQLTYPFSPEISSTIWWVSYNINIVPLIPLWNSTLSVKNPSEQRIRSVHFPLRGVVKYRGPLPIASFPGRSIIRSANQPDPPMLAYLVMNEPLDLGSVLGGLENFPRGLETLDIQIMTHQLPISLFS